MAFERFEERLLMASPTMHTEEMQYIQEAFDRNWIAPLGFNCDGFEEETVRHLQHGDELHALCLASGTSALHLAYKLAGVKRGSTVLATDMTFAATVNPAVYEGARLVFVDSERDTWNMDPRALEKAFELHPEARVVALAHLYGTPAKIDEIEAVCEANGAVLIEDAAEALGATYQGRACGTFGDYGILSFNGNKIITTSGGGMLLTHSKAARDKALFWATQSREPAPWYQHEEIGYNYRMSNVVAGIGRGQLKHLEEHVARKEAIYRRYEAGFAGSRVKMNPYMEGVERPNFWLSCLELDEGSAVGPMDVFAALNDANIESRPIWKPMHMQPVFAGCDFVSVVESPVDEGIFAHGLCLPSDIKMTEEQQERVIEVILNTVKGA